MSTGFMLGTYPVCTEGFKEVLDQIGYVFLQVFTQNESGGMETSQETDLTIQVTSNTV